MAEWSDKYSTLKSEVYKLADNKEWRFTLEEDKNKGTLQVNARCFTIAQREGGYSGPSKNGFIIPINSLDDFDKVKECFTTFANFIDGCKEYIE